MSFNKPFFSHLASLFFTFLLFILQQPLFAQKYKSKILNISDLKSQSTILDSILSRPDYYRVQIQLTQVDRTKKGKVKLTDYAFRTDLNEYYYPASTVKFPIVLLSLQKLNELAKPGLDMNSSMETGANRPSQTEVFNDPTSRDGRASVAQYIKKILLVSDNDAFNRLYEMLGQEYINKSLQKNGYTKTQIKHRLSVSLPAEENRWTNPVSFYDTSCKLLFAQPAQYSRFSFPETTIKMGQGYIDGNDSLVNAPFDFSNKNRFPLADLHGMLKQFIFPEYKTRFKKFNLTDADRDFVMKYMSMVPRESDYPYYDSIRYPDNCAKFLYYGGPARRKEEGLQMFSKAGDAYGFMIDAAYFKDTVNNVEFILSAIIYCNSDGIFNDDQYDYNTVGLPFMSELGRVILNGERLRKARSKN